MLSRDGQHTVRHRDFVIVISHDSFDKTNRFFSILHLGLATSHRNIVPKHSILVFFNSKVDCWESQGVVAIYDAISRY